MKSTAIACAIAAGALGFGSLSFAQGYDGGGDRDGRRGHSQRADRGDRVDQRAERRDNRQEWRAEQRQQRHYRPDNQYVQQPRYQAPHHDRQYGQQYGQYGQQYGQQHGQRSQWVSHGHRYQRGDHLPYQFRQRQYYVNDWRSHRGLYAPPYGYHWVQADGGDYLLVAIATGLIANLLLSQ